MLLDSTVSEILLAPANMDVAQLAKSLENVSSKNVDDADLFLQYRQEETWNLEDSIVKACDLVIDRGFGLRVVSGEKTGFAYADDITWQALCSAGNNAKSIVFAGQSGKINISNQQATKKLYPALNPVLSLSDEQKVLWLQQIDVYLRAKDSRVTQVTLNLSAEYEVVLLLNKEGQLQHDIRPMVQLFISVQVQAATRREKGFAGSGARLGFDFFSQALKFQLADKALQQALNNLDAIAAPAGVMPVVLGPGWPAVLLHEAIGHGLEADHIRKNSSIFSNQLGERVASELCTIVDDGSLVTRRGSVSMDDEGVAGEKTVLIENGKLVGFMHDKLSARLMNMKTTGNGRRESYADIPLPRMTNTMMLAGKTDPAEIIASVKKGIYAVDFSGGQVDTASGNFVFSASEAYLIENGKIGAPIKGATLIGNGLEVLKKVSMLGNDLALDPGIGVCGKEGQSVPVGVGQPTVKLESLTVGGQQ